MFLRPFSHVYLRVCPTVLPSDGPSVGWPVGNRFLVATKRLYKRVCPSVGPSVRRSVSPSVTLSLFGLLGATYGRVSGLVDIMLQLLIF